MKTPIYDDLQMYLARVVSMSKGMVEDEKSLIAEATEKFVTERRRMVLEQALQIIKDEEFALDNEDPSSDRDLIATQKTHNVLDSIKTRIAGIV